MSDTLELLARQRGWSEEEARLRRSICEIGKLCYSRNYIVGADGNISARMADGTILITPAGAMKGFLEPQHVAHIDMQGKVVDGGPGASSERGIHIACYEERPEIKAVVHAHPPHAVAMTIAGIDMQAPFIPEIVVMSKVTWDRLSRDDQALVRRLAREAQLEQRALWDKATAE